ncbi:MAG: YXWGXW repeat-containing protein [Myxococcales bacterium]|nr:YXWGXW repeat-containing protein [Myxococcales bacterium]
MRNVSTLSTLSTLALSSALLASACYHTPPPVILVVRHAPHAMRVPDAPPPPKQEEPAPPPDASYVWAPGYWNWAGNDYDWVPGRWLPPRDGYDFVPALYSFAGGVWLFRPCFWRPRPRIDRGGALAGRGPRTRPSHGPRFGKGPGAAPAHNPGYPPGSGAGRTRKPAPSVARVRRPAPGVGSIEQNAQRATTSVRHRTVVLKHGEGVVTVRPSSSGRVDASALRRRGDYQGKRGGRMAFGNTAGRGYMLYGKRYRVDRTGAFVLGDGRGRVRARSGGAFHRTDGGGLTVVASNTRRRGAADRRRDDGNGFGVAARARQARHRRALLGNPNWRPRRGGTIYDPRTRRTYGAVHGYRGGRDYRVGRTYRTPSPRGRVYRPSYGGRVYRPTRNAYRPTHRYHGYSARQRVYRAPRHNYRRSSGSSRSYRRSSTSSRRSSGVSRSRGGSRSSSRGGGGGRRR